MAYKITVSDGPVTVTVETDVADDAAAVLAVSVLQKVQRSKSFDPPRPNYYWDGPDRNVSPDWWRKGAEASGSGNPFPINPYTLSELAVAKQQL